jgi:uncharacterized DUF497 family protein
VPSLDQVERAFESSPGTPRQLYGVVRYASHAYIAVVTVTFDPKKNAANLKKHGVSLAEGDGVLNDPLALTIEDDSADGEQRFVSVGMSSFGSLMVAAYTHRGDVRKAEPKERRAYEKEV